MKEAILFDLDGTLTNTDVVHYNTWQEILRGYGLEIDPVFYDQHFSGRMNKDILLDILPQLSTAEAIALGDRKESEFRQRAKDTLVPLPGLLSLLDWCDRHRVRKAVVTNAPIENAEFMLDVLKLQDRFPVVIIGEQVEFGKPHPMPYRVGMQRLEVAAESAIAFEDSPTGMMSAVGAGLFTVGIDSTHPAQKLY
ncbi:MAG: HAD family phosphatase, partial [Okeania sp. SIO2H7]|nr:HAD family phosphatase [Okeania sp. SIO2H7]